MRGDDRTSVRSISLRQGARGIYGMNNKEAGLSEVWRAWEAWGKVIGKRCGNRSFAQL